jgi:hypothetical protein
MAVLGMKSHPRSQPLVWYHSHAFSFGHTSRSVCAVTWLRRKRSGIKRENNFFIEESFHIKKEKSFDK